MNAKRVEYHEGASADVRNAVAWYLERSPKAARDFIEELQRAADTIREAPDRWPPGQSQYQTVPALAISLFHHLLGTRIPHYNLGGRPWKPTTGVLGPAAEIGRLGRNFDGSGRASNGAPGWGSNFLSRQKKRKDQNPHPNVAKYATLGWATRPIDLGTRL